MFESIIYQVGSWHHVETGDDWLTLYRKALAGAQEFNAKAESTESPHIENVCVIDLWTGEVIIHAESEELEDY